ncbi:MAG: hypothetical protein J6U17_01985 [Kiritimatiellae bacterium]|nr:hypothetical protein [Kiritimatiellia bacterium]
MKKKNIMLAAMTIAAGLLGAGCVTDGCHEEVYYPAGYARTEYVHYSPAYVQTAVMDPIVPPPPRPHATHLSHRPPSSRHGPAKKRHEPKPAVAKSAPKPSAKPAAKAEPKTTKVHVRNPSDRKPAEPKRTTPIYKKPQQTKTGGVTKIKATPKYVHGKSGGKR